MKSKLLKIIALFAVVLSSFSLFGCKPDEPPVESVKYSDIFVAHDSIQPYTHADKLFTLPEGYALYSDSSTGYSDAYMQVLGGFLIKKTVDNVAYYGVCNMAGVVVVPVEYTSFSVSYGYFSGKKGNGVYDMYNISGVKLLTTKMNGSTLEVYDGTGAVLLTTWGSFSSENAVTTIFMPISGKYVALRTGGGFCSIFDVDGQRITGDIAGTPATFKAVDDILIRTRTVNKIKTIDIFTLPNTSAQSDKAKIAASGSSSTVNAFYLGDGNFYCYNVDVVTSEDEYDYVNLSGEYCDGDFFYYNVYDDARTPASKKYIYAQLFNEYNMEEAGGYDLSLYLKKGYSFVSIGTAVADDKTTKFDEYIINSKGEILISMTSSVGSAVTYSKNTSEYREVLLTYISGIGFSATGRGPLRLYDINGNLAFEMTDANYANVFFNNGVITAARTTDDISDSKITPTYYYVAYTLGGDMIVSPDRKLTKLTAFVGDYALAEYLDDGGNTKTALIDKQGVMYPLDVYYNGTSKTYLYKTGAYINKRVTTPEGGGSVTQYGLLNYEGYTLVDYAPSGVIAKYGINTVFYYTIANGIYSVYSVKN